MKDHRTFVLDGQIFGVRRHVAAFKARTCPRTLKQLARRYPRDFSFYVADPISSYSHTFFCASVICVQGTAGGTPALTIHSSGQSCIITGL
jgi:hypothetical protein